MFLDLLYQVVAYLDTSGSILISNSSGMAGIGVLRLVVRWWMRGTLRMTRGAVRLVKVDGADNAATLGSPPGSTL